jgi:hypothetical protein
MCQQTQTIWPKVDIFNLLSEKTSDFNSISTDDVDRQSVDNGNLSEYRLSGVCLCLEGRLWSLSCKKAGK